MKRAYLIYQPEETEKNEGFIRMFQEKGRAEGFAFSCVTSEEYRKKPLPELVLNRTRQPEVSRWYEEKGIFCLHGSRFVELANHKYLTLLQLQNSLPPEILREKWCPATTFLGAVSGCGQGLDLPGGRGMGREWVIKSVHGHGGTEVFLADEAEKYGELLRGKDCILQERILSDSRDLRVYLLGGQIYQAVLRTGAEGDFRSNFSLGGRASLYRLNRKEREYIENFIRAVWQNWGEIGIAGIDFILDREGRLIFNEIEDMVGCRMLYQCGGGDIVGDFVRYLRKSG